MAWTLVPLSPQCPPPTREHALHDAKAEVPQTEHCVGYDSVLKD